MFAKTNRRDLDRNNIVSFLKYYFTNAFANAKLKVHLRFTINFRCYSICRRLASSRTRPHNKVAPVCLLFLL